MHLVTTSSPLSPIVDYLIVFGPYASVASQLLLTCERFPLAIGRLGLGTQLDRAGVWCFQTSADLMLASVVGCVVTSHWIVYAAVRA